MPKRVLDFDALWSSDKLAACAPWAQAEYAWLYGLADCNGSFELTNLRVIWGRVAAIRASLTLERLEQIFDEFMARGLLFTWEANGKRYGHWTGSDQPGRLPPPSWRARLERLAPAVPRAELGAFMAGFAQSKIPPRERSGTIAPKGAPASGNEGLSNSSRALEEGQRRLEAAQGQGLNLDLGLDRKEEKGKEGEWKTLALDESACAGALESGGSNHFFSDFLKQKPAEERRTGDRALRESTVSDAGNTARRAPAETHATGSNHGAANHPAATNNDAGTNRYGGANRYAPGNRTGGWNRYAAANRVLAELRLGTGPVLGAGRVRPEALKRIREREGRLRAQELEALESRGGKLHAGGLQAGEAMAAKGNGPASASGAKMAKSSKNFEDAEAQDWSRFEEGTCAD